MHAFHKLLINFTWCVNRRTMADGTSSPAGFWPGQYLAVRSPRPRCLTGARRIRRRRHRLGGMAAFCFHDAVDGQVEAGQ